MDSMDSMDHPMNVGSLSQWVGLMSWCSHVGAQLRISFEDFLRAYEASLRTDRLRAVGDLEWSAQIGSDLMALRWACWICWKLATAKVRLSLLRWGCTIYPYRHLRGEGKVKPGNVRHLQLKYIEFLLNSAEFLMCQSPQTLRYSENETLVENVGSKGGWHAGYPMSCWANSPSQINSHETAMLLRIP